MSHVTEIILITSLLDADCDDDETPTAEMDSINEWTLVRWGSLLARVDNHAHGDKAFQSAVFIGAWDRIIKDIPEFLMAVKNQHWELPDSVQVLIKDEHDENFTVYRLFDIGKEEIQWNRKQKWKEGGGSTG